MTMFEFQLLPQEEQITILYQQGIYIGKKKINQLAKLLFQVESFYVELTYTHYRQSIQKITYCDSTTILDPYLEQIDVEYLVT